MALTKTKTKTLAQFKSQMGNRGPGMIGQVVTSQQANNLCDAELRSVLFSICEFELPLTPEELSSHFGGTINFFTAQMGATACPITNLPILATMQDNFLLHSVCIKLRVDPYGFAASGAAVAVPGGPTDVPPFDGQMPEGGLTGDDTATLAVWEHGQPAWRAAKAFMEAYTLNLILCNRFVALNDKAATFGCMCADGFEGAGSGQSAPQDRQYLMNQRYNELGSLGTGKNFIFPNVDDADDVDSDGLPANLVQSVHGEFLQCGTLGCACFRLPQPIFMPIGAQIELFLEQIANETIWHNRLLQELGQPFPNSVIPVAPNYNNAVAGAFDAQTAAAFFKSGIFSVEVSLMGVVLDPCACTSYFVQGSTAVGVGGVGAQRFQQLQEVWGGVAGVEEIKGLLAGHFSNK